LREYIGNGIKSTHVDIWYQRASPHELSYRWKMGNHFRIAAVAAALGGTMTCGGIGLAPKASAGCQTPLLADTYCDGPIRPDGTWERCHTSPGGPVYGGRGVVGSWLPPVNTCFQVDPSQPWPIGQPQFHVDD
jgi:hypothetical protein